MTRWARPVKQRATKRCRTAAPMDRDGVFRLQLQPAGPVRLSTTARAVLALSFS